VLPRTFPTKSAEACTSRGSRLRRPVYRWLLGMLFDDLLKGLTNVESIVTKGSWDRAERSLQEAALDAFLAFPDAYRIASTFAPTETADRAVALLEELESSAIEVLHALHGDAGIPAKVEQRFAEAMHDLRQENAALCAGL
jgi:hypothetical protein